MMKIQRDVSQIGCGCVLLSLVSEHTDPDNSVQPYVIGKFYLLNSSPALLEVNKTKLFPTKC